MDTQTQLCYQRTNRKLGARIFAIACGIPAKRYIQIEGGEVEPTSLELAAIHKVLELNPINLTEARKVHFLTDAEKKLLAWNDKVEVLKG